MPWEVWVATNNSVHGEDDVAYWLHPEGEQGIVAVSDGVSASAGGGASYLVAHGLVAICKSIDLASTRRAAQRCLALLDSAAREASIEEADIVAAAKRRYYMEKCSPVCLNPPTPLSLREIAEAGVLGEEARREETPSATLLAAILGGDGEATIMLHGDGTVMGVTGRKEETWLLWGTLPQYYEGSRLIRFVEVGRGVRGEPLIVTLTLRDDTWLAIATDGVDPAALADALVEHVRKWVRGEEGGEAAARAGEGAGYNPAGEVLRRVLDQSVVEDDATLALIHYRIG